MDEEENNDDKVITLFGNGFTQQEVDDEGATIEQLLSNAAESGYDKMLVLGVGGGDIGFLTNIETVPEMVYLIERVKHYLVTLGMDD